MTIVDITHLRSWIGRTETRSDVITPGLVERLRATLGITDHARDGTLPLMLHWCLAPVSVPASELGADGHPARGGFLPPVPLPRRMWAGGSIEFYRPLQVGDVVTRRSHIADVTERTGRTGNLIFVTVQHEISTEAGLAIGERQDIVYREAQAASTSATSSAAMATPDADHSETIEATTTLLFRYSALTFNGHRIHYDLDYAREVEGYGGLVVHGPLQATFLVNLAARLHEGRVRKFDFRALAPLFAGTRFMLNARRTEAGLELWTVGRHGEMAMKATAEFG